MSAFHCVSCEASNLDAVRCRACGGRRFAMDRLFVEQVAARFADKGLAPIVSLDQARARRARVSDDTARRTRPEKSV